MTVWTVREREPEEGWQKITSRIDTCRKEEQLSRYFRTPNAAVVGFVE